MGNKYVNFTLRGPTQEAVAHALAGREALVTPLQKGCVVALDKESETGENKLITDLALYLSQELDCLVLAIRNWDDDILWYQLCDKGRMIDEYDSSPGYWDPVAEPSNPKGGDARRLCAAFGTSDVALVEGILRRSSFDEGGYAFAFERHADLIRALSISDFGICIGYEALMNDEYPEGLSPGDLMRASSVR
jgi:hypothetical protein